MLDAKLALTFVLGALAGAVAERCGGHRSGDPAQEPSRPATAGDACEACLSAAASGNVPGAAKAAGSCNDDTKKKQCTSKVKSSAPTLAKAAATNQQCGDAKAIAAAAQSMGAGSSSLKNAVKSCQ